MKKKIVLAAVLVLMLVPLSLGAQAAGNAEFQFLSIDIGYAPGWGLGPNGGFVTPALFGLNIRVANNLSAGIQYMKEGAVEDSYLLLKYNILPQVRAVVGFGVQDIAAPPPVVASSLGIEFIPFSRSVGGVAATEFKLAVKYDSPFADMTTGKILFALAFGIGF
jgi:hypothetical protein